jgi:hypothetical protein
MLKLATLAGLRVGHLDSCAAEGELCGCVKFAMCKAETMSLGLTRVKPRQLCSPGELEVSGKVAVRLCFRRSDETEGRRHL